MEGIIFKALSGFYYVDDGSGTITACRGRGKLRHEKITPLVGDRVEVRELGGGEGFVEAIRPRRNAFARPAVANIDQLVIIASGAIPRTDPFLIDRVAAIAALKDCDVIVLLNKCDLDPAEDLYGNSVSAEKIISLNMPVMMGCVYACILLISWFGAKMIVGGTGLTTGQLTSLLSYIMNILMSLMMISMIYVMLTMSAESAKRICQVLDEESNLHNPAAPVTTVADGSVDFENVSFKYSRKARRSALENINLHIASGMTVGVLGGTGAGKSTLVQLIPRLYDVTEGSVKVGGVDVRDYDLDTLRSAVSMVLQKNQLFSGTIKDNLRWGNENATDQEMEEACRLAQADGFIRSFPDGYDTWIEQGGANVSGGQKQRLCIARALLKKPKILILDDSTSAVDTRTDAMIRKAFREEIPNTTKLIIAQRVTSVMDADMILVLDDGHVVGQGTHAQLMESCAIYREVYESQQEGVSIDG